MYNQSDYSISARYNEYYKIMSTLKVHRDKMQQEGANTEIIDDVINKLEVSGGGNLAPNHMDFIFLVLLKYVPEEVKEKY